MKIGVITGASSGLGAEFARRAKTFAGGLEELWLIARRGDRLRAMETEIQGCRVRSLSLDLADPASFSEYRLLLEAERPDVRLLVGCAGLGFLGDFERINLADDMAMCDVNVRALTLLTAQTIPYMSSGSGIILISSIASFVPTPRMTVYASTKAYVSSLAKGLRAELSPRGIHVLAVNPCPMDTPFLKIGNILGNSRAFARLPRCQPAKVAEVSLRRCEKGRGQYTPLLLFKVYRVLAKLLPHTLLMRISRV